MHLTRSFQRFYRSLDMKDVYHKSPFLSGETLSLSSSPAALVILNAPIRQPPSPLFTRLWKHCTYHVCADGGANRLYQATVHDKVHDNDNKETTTTSFLPDLIRGDLDSLQAHVQTYYQQCGTKIERDADQDCNDLDKALQAVLRHFTEQQQQQDDDDDNKDTSCTPSCFVYGAFGGRLDQEMASIQALWKWSDHFHHQVWLYNDDTCAILLPPHVKNHITLAIPPPSTKHNNDNDSTTSTSSSTKIVIGEGPTCGLIPIGCPCETVTTTGLQWNLQGQRLAFGGLVSSSNHMTQPTITVTTSHPLIFTAQVSSGMIHSEWN